MSSTHASVGHGEDRSLRRLLAVVGAVVFLDMVFYTALAPLLPGYAERLALSKAQAGVLQGTYAAGILVFALPCGWLAARFGVRRATVCGLCLLAVASVIFACAQSIVVLDLARLLQGVSAACSWAGALAWLVAAAPAHRRGELVGAALGVSLLGCLAGPAAGALAELMGALWFFGSVAGLALVVAAAALRIEAPAALPLPSSRALIRAVRAGSFGVPLAMLAVFGLTGAVIGTLIPLRLGTLGAGAAPIAATFLVAAAVEAGVNPLSGRMGDRHRDRLAPLRVALPVAGLCLVLLAAAAHPLVIAVLTVATLAAVGFVYTPVSALLADRAELAALPLPLAYALLNLFWAVGSTMGSVGGGALAQRTGDTSVYCVVAILCLALAVSRERPGFLRRVEARDLSMCRAPGIVSRNAPL